MRENGRQRVRRDRECGGEGRMWEREEMVGE